MTDLMLDQFDGTCRQELKKILRGEKRRLMDSDLSGSKEFNTQKNHVPIETSHLSRLKFPGEFLKKVFLRCGSIPVANFLVTLWRGGDL